ncbi:MAG TPA: MoxR family ATPase [Pirellulales bacterium]|nr:MoxR family ATPase [Pirellulales bacterium]
MSDDSNSPSGMPQHPAGLNPQPTAGETALPPAPAWPATPAQPAAIERDIVAPLAASASVSAGPAVSAPGAQAASHGAQPASAGAAPRTGPDVASIKRLFDRVTAEIGKIYVGQDEFVLTTLVALFSGGHVLIESVPGLGKTLFVRALGRVLGCQFGRIQFTADLMPSDITGAPIFDMKTQEFRFRPGPVFTQFLLADEINRSPAKTHAALLEIMQEYRVTVERTSHKLKRPFLVLATQNPIESEGTYNLPEAQLDRFMFKIVANYPTAAEEAEILKQHSRQVDLDKRLSEELAVVTGPDEIMEALYRTAQILVDDKLIDYINRIVRLTREWSQFHMGASPRAGIALVQGARTLAAFRGRDYAVPDDVAEIARPALRHRVSLTAEAEVEGHRVDDVLTELIRSVEVPRL